MKRILTSILPTLLAIFVAASCVKSNPAPQGSLTVVGGIDNNELIVSGAADAGVNFQITAKMAWEILPTNGIVFNPTSGEAAQNINITATSTQSNNSLDRVRLGDVVFKLGTTRFVGVTAYQAPQIVLKDSPERKIYIAANRGAQSTCDFSCATSDFDVETDGDISVTVSIIDSFKGLYRLIVTSKADNASNDTTSLGSISFSVKGVKQSGKIDVVQQQAIRFDRSRILMNGNIGSECTVAAVSPFPCTVSTTSNAFSAQCNTDNSITLKTIAENGSNEEIQAGKLIVSLRDYPSCRLEIDVWQRSAQCDETMLFYYLGTSLRSYFTTNLNMVEQALATGLEGSKRVVALLQTSTYSAELYELYYDRFDKTVYRPLIKKIDLPATYSASMLAEVWGEMMQTAPAKQYSLIVGSHGLAWVPKTTQSKQSTSLLSSAFANYWQHVPNAEVVRHLGEGSAATLIDTTEFAEACSMLEAPFRYIIFDACYMSNIESAYDMRNTAEYILASPCEVLGKGLPYNIILPIMFGNDATAQMLDNVAKRCVEEALNQTSGTISSCTAVIKCNELEALAASFKEVYAAIPESFDCSEVQTYDGLNSWSHPHHHFFDLADYAKKGCSNAAALARFEERYAEAVFGLYHTPSFYSAFNGMLNAIVSYNGVTTSLPILYDAQQLYDAELRQTAWYKAITEE